MRRLTSTDKGALLLASALVVGGVLLVWKAPGGLFNRPVTDDLGVPGNSREEVSPTMARFAGGIAVLLGCGLAAGILLPKE